MNELVTVIVPVYNAADNVNKLNFSIVNQTYKNIEIIYINDGSTDNSLEILNSFGKLDKRIKVINQENSGASIARNKGIAAAKGKYIYFCDADDFIELNTIEIMLTEGECNNADIVVCNYRDILPTGEVIRNNYFASQFKGSSLKENKEILFIKPALWNKMFKKDLFIINDIKFEDTRIAQDLCTTLKLISVAQNIVAVDNILYNYVLHDNTISRSFDERILDIRISLDSLYTFYSKQNLKKEYLYELDYIAIQNILYQIMKISNMRSKNKKIIYNELIKYLNSISTVDNNKYLNNSFIYKLAYKIFSNRFFFLNPLSQFILRLSFRNTLFYKLLRKFE